MDFTIWSGYLLKMQCLCTEKDLFPVSYSVQNKLYAVADIQRPWDFSYLPHQFYMLSKCKCDEQHVKSYRVKHLKFRAHQHLVYTPCDVFTVYSNENQLSVTIDRTI